MEPTYNKTPEIAPLEIEYKEVIGVGAFGQVIRGICRGKDVAIKKLHKPITDEETLIAFKTEVAIMSTIFHPNICLFMGACTQAGNFFIVQEFLPGGDVEKLLRNATQDIPLYRRMQMAKDAALGVNWLHCSNPSLVHRDLKSSNLLIDENGKVKVCDFGLAQVKPSRLVMLHDEDHAKGTPLWMAPEVMQFKEFNEKADVYSFGIVLWELLTRKEPFAHHSNYAKFRKAVCVKHERPDVPLETEPSLKVLIEKCWHQNPNARPDFKQIISALDIILINVAVRDQLGRQFWYTFHSGGEEVAWDIFKENLTKFLSLPVNTEKQRVELNFKCLKEILIQKLANSTREIVTLTNWGRILQFFGPITIPATANGLTFLDEITKIFRQPWFHGDTDSQRAQELLSGKPSGTFMIRFSNSVQGWYTISQIEGKVIQHQRISHQPAEPYVIEDASYGTIYDLISQRNLEQPCEGSRYNRIVIGPNDIINYDNGYLEEKKKRKKKANK